LDAARSDVPVHRLFVGLLPVFQTFNCVVAVSRERDFEQTFQINTSNLVAPALGCEVVQMPTKVPSSTQRSDSEPSTLSSALNALTVAFRIYTS